MNRGITPRTVSKYQEGLRSRTWKRWVDKLCIPQQNLLRGGEKVPAHSRDALLALVDVVQRGFYACSA